MAVNPYDIENLRTQVSDLNQTQQVNRGPSPTIDPQAAFTPVAAPVSTYVRPQEPNKSSLFGVAAALQGLSGELDAWTSSQKSQEKENGEAQAESDWLSGNKEGVIKATQDGIFPTFQNPFYVRRMKQLQGADTGRTLAAKMQQDYLQSGVQNSDDPNAYNTWAKDWLQKNADGIGDPHMRAAALPAVSATSAALLNSHTQTVQERMLSQTNDLAQREMMGIIGDNTAAGTSKDVVATKLQNLKTQLVGSGVNPEAANKMVQSSIATFAENTGDASILDLYDAKDASGHAMSERLDVQKIKQDTFDRIAASNHSKEQQAYAAQQREKKATLDDATGQIMDILSKDPNAAIPDDVFSKARKADPKISLQVAEWRKSFMDHSVDEDPRAIRQVELDVDNAHRFGGDATQVVRDALDAGTIRDPGTARRMLDHSRSLQEGGAAQGTDILGNPDVKSNLKLLEDTLTPSGFASLLDQGKGGINPNQAEINAAQNYYRRSLMDWRTKNPTATAQQQTEFNDYAWKRTLGFIQSNTGLNYLTTPTKPTDVNPPQWHFTGPNDAGMTTNRSDNPNRPQDATFNEQAVPIKRAYSGQTLPEGSFQALRNASPDAPVSSILGPLSKGANGAPMSPAEYEAAHPGIKGVTINRFLGATQQPVQTPAQRDGKGLTFDNAPTGKRLDIGNLTGGAFHTHQDLYDVYRGLGVPDPIAKAISSVQRSEGGVAGKIYTGSYGGQPTERGGVLNPHGAYGISQWNGPRQARLLDYAQSHNMNPGDLRTQALFTLHELKNYYPNVNPSSIPDLVKHFEMPADRYIDGEINNASQHSTKLATR